MEKVTTGERLAVLETKLTDLDNKMSDVYAEVKAISMTLAAQGTEYIKLKAEMKVLEKRVEEQLNHSHFWRWFAPTLSAVMGSIVTFLIIEYLKHL